MHNVVHACVGSCVVPSTHMTDVQQPHSPKVVTLERTHPYQPMFGELNPIEANLKPAHNLCGSALTRPDQLRILTYNIWFERTEQEDRLDSIIQIILDSDADFVCL